MIFCWQNAQTSRPSWITETRKMRSESTIIDGNEEKRQHKGDKFTDFMRFNK